MREWITWLTLAVAFFAAPAAAEPLRITATVPELASIARAVGGEEVEAVALVRGTQDPHFVEPRPSFIRRLHDTDLFLEIGLQLEAGWVPPLISSARNPKIRPGGSGSLDLVRVIPLLGVARGTVDRSMGDVHPDGNPHYLADPANGVRVARAIRDRLSSLRPEAQTSFEQQTAAFEAEIARALVGDSMATPPDAAIDAMLGDDFDAWIAAREAEGLELGGWLAAMRSHRGRPVVADHKLWPYFAKRFGIEVVAWLEPLPGIPPTTRHLSEVAELMEQKHIKVILSSAYFHPRYAHRLADATNASVLEMANQVDAREGVTDYLAMIGWNVRQLADAL